MPRSQGLHRRLACLALCLLALPSPGSAILARVTPPALPALANLSLAVELRSVEHGFLKLLHSAVRDDGQSLTTKSPEMKGFLSRDFLRTVGIEKEEEEHLDEYIFHCEKNSGFKGQISLCQALLILSVLCLLAGSAAFLQLKHAGTRLERAVSDNFWGPTLEKLMLACACFGGCGGYFGRLFSDIMVVIGFAYCGHGWLLVVSLFILLGSQIYSAYEYATLKIEDSEDSQEVDRGPVSRFMLSLFQMRICIDAWNSWQRGEVVDSLARQKFIDAIVDSGPFAIFAVYVIFYFDIRYDTWLTLSVFGSILGLAYHVTIWIIFTLEKQLQELEIPQSEYSVQWNHYVLWLSYFTVDFSLRLVTLGLFLSIEKAHPWNQFIFLLLLLTYSVAVSANVMRHEKREGKTVDYYQVDEEVVAIRRRVIKNHLGAAVVLSFLVNALPADLRIASDDSEERTKTMVLEDEVRRSIMWTIIPLRAVEYVVLGSVAMIFDFNPWQCASIVGMWVAMHLLLYQVLQLPKPPPPVVNASMKTAMSIGKTMSKAASHPKMDEGSPVSEAASSSASPAKESASSPRDLPEVTFLGSRKIKTAKKM